MANLFGLDALNLLNAADDAAGHTNKFSKLASGDKRIVKVLNFGDFVGVQTYSIFKKVNTFVPKNPPTLSAKGFPVDNLTPFDKAWKYYQDKSESMGDEASKSASNFRIKPRFAIGFYDLDSKECIVIDFSKTQAQDIVTAIQKNEKKLGKKAFELEKMGTGTKTKVSLTALDLDDLTPEQEAAFESAPAEFDKSLFENLYFEQDEAKMLESLAQVSFDVSLIGYEKADSTESNAQDDSTDDTDPTELF